MLSRVPFRSPIGVAGNQAAIASSPSCLLLTLNCSCSPANSGVDMLRPTDRRSERSRPWRSGACLTRNRWIHRYDLGSAISHRALFCLSAKWSWSIGRRCQRLCSARSTQWQKRAAARCRSVHNAASRWAVTMPVRFPGWRTGGDCRPIQRGTVARPANRKPALVGADPQLLPGSKAHFQRRCGGPEQQGQSHHEKIQYAAKPWEVRF